MPLGTGRRTSAVVIHGTTFLVTLRSTIWSRHLHTKLWNSPNHSKSVAAPHLPPDLGNRDVGFESEVSTAASFLETWFPSWSQPGGITLSCQLCVWPSMLGHRTIWEAVMWKELRHEGQGSGLPSCSTRRQSGTKPRQRLRHTAKRCRRDWVIQSSHFSGFFFQKLVCFSSGLLQLLEFSC